MLDGKQYVLIASGNTLVAFAPARATSEAVDAQVAEPCVRAVDRAV